MQIETLKIFCDLADSSSFKQCATRSRVRIGAVIQQIASLEKKYKTQLIYRTKNQIHITQRGQVLYEQFKKILELYSKIEVHLNETVESDAMVKGESIDQASQTCTPSGDTDKAALLINLEQRYHAEYKLLFSSNDNINLGLRLEETLKQVSSLIQSVSKRVDNLKKEEMEHYQKIKSYCDSSWFLINSIKNDPKIINLITDFDFQKEINKEIIEFQQRSNSIDHLNRNLEEILMYVSESLQSAQEICFEYQENNLQLYHQIEEEFQKLTKKEIVE